MNSALNESARKIAHARALASDFLSAYTLKMPFFPAFASQERRHRVSCGGASRTF